MEPFTIEIAGIVMNVQSLFASTREYCKRYLTDKEAEFQIVVTREDLVREQAMLEKEALEQSIRPRKFPEPFLERATILRKTADYLLKNRTLLLHGSTVGVDGAAYLFTAPCGTGKSTHTRLWRQVFGDRAVMINDDKAFLGITDDGVLACGSPWSGKHGLDTNIRLPLRGICVLRRGKTNVISRAANDELLELLRQQILGYTDTVDLTAAYGLLEHLANLVPVWHLSCNMDQDAAVIAYRAMSS